MRGIFGKFLTGVLSCAVAGILAAAPGLDAPQPIGPYLNGVFPQTTPGPAGTWAVVDAFPQLTFVDPVRMVKDPLSSGHVYIVCRNGDIWRIPFDSGAVGSQKVRFLDRRANTWGYWDAGMMSMVFHPDFGKPGNPNRGYVYVFYQYVPQKYANPSPGSSSYMRLSRFTVPDGQVAADPASEFVMIQQYDRHNWHNGGQMFFGPEGFLHVVIGDEGDANDSLGVCQKIDDRLFSGILRIDVDNDPSRSHPIRRQPRQISMPSGWQPSFTQGYSIPNDNPWQDPSGGVLEEFWSIGTRSPHSMHFDKASGEIWIADVGQGTREEITVARRGGNHQWPYREGLASGPKAKPANLIGVEVPPVFDYGRAMGGCIIGGMVYRGSLHAGALTGKYLFGDHNTRALYALERPASGAAQAQYLTSVPRSGGNKRGLAGICEGPDGEVYFMELGDTGTDTGKIYKLARTGPPVADPPLLLSQTGAFTDLADLTPRAGLIPYEVNSPLWSDGAEKQRWVAVPNDGSHDTPAEQVVYRDKGAWAFPKGTVLVKHFALPVDERDPEVVKPVETRFFVHGSDGVYYGVTYRWNEEGTDAVLLAGGDSRDFVITSSDGSSRVQRWDFPSRADCRTCHNASAENVLGLQAHQMARDMSYALTGRSAGQLETWDHIGIFGASFAGRNPAAIPRGVDPHDPHASLDHRVRSYLAANCAHCHHPDGVTANFDASFETPLSAQNLVNGLINRPLHGADDRVVSPGSVADSILHTRFSVTGAGQMPPLGKNVVDQKAVDLIVDWIRSLDAAGFVDSPANTAPQAMADDLPATHAAESALDVLANDSDAEAPPGIHGVAIVSPPSHGTVRISGAGKRILYMHDGSRAREDEFAYTLTDPQGAVSQPVTVRLRISFDFAAWSAVTPGAGGSPQADLDGDLWPDLLEFALGGNPGDGAVPPDVMRVVEDAGNVSFRVRRPSGLSGVVYVLETSPDLVEWNAMDEGTVEEDGDFERLEYAGVQDRPGLSADNGFARLRVELSGEQAHAVTLPLGWRTVAFGAGSRTFGMPFREPPVFASAVTGMEGHALLVHGSPPILSRGFVEVVSGGLAGHRFELESVAPGRISLAVNGPHTLTPVPDLTGARIVLCAHHTVGGLFPKSVFQGSTNPAAADQLQFYRNDGGGPGAFELFYLLDARPGNPTHQWRAFLPGGGDQGMRVIAPGEGVFVKRPASASPVRVFLTGQVRANAFHQPLRAGMNFASSPFPLPMSARQRGMNDPASGFRASANLSQADQFQIYQNGRFRIFFLLDHPTQPDPWREAVAGSPDHSDASLFFPDESVFIRRASAGAAYHIHPPWPP